MYASLVLLLLSQAVAPIPPGVAQVSQFTTTANVDLYVSTNGVDNGVCSQSAPCLTVQAACNLIPPQDSHVVTVHIGAGTFAGCFLQGKRIMNYDNGTKAGIRFQGTLQAASTATGTASGTLTSVSVESGLTRQTMTDSGQAWTSNDLKGKLFCLTSGASSGTCAVIVSNTSTAVTAMGLWGNSWTTPGTASVGNTYTIKDWATTISSGSGFQVPSNLVLSTQSTTSTTLGFLLADIIGGGQPSGLSTLWGPGLIDISALKFTSVTAARIHSTVGGVSFWWNSITSGASGLGVIRSPETNVMAYANYFSTTGSGFSLTGGAAVAIRDNYSDACSTFISGASGNVVSPGGGFTDNEIECTTGLQLGPSSYVDQATGNHFNCESRSSSFGVRVQGNAGEGTGLANVSFSSTSGSAVNGIDNCVTGVSVTGNGTVTFSGDILSGSGNTTAFSLANGGRVFASSPSITGTTYLSMDSRTFTHTQLQTGDNHLAMSLATGSSYVESYGTVGGFQLGDTLVPVSSSNTLQTCASGILGGVVSVPGSPSKTCKCITTSGGAYQWAKIADDTGTVTTSGGSSTACP